MADRHGKLTEAQVVEIIDRYAAGRATCRQLAAEYGVSPQAISNIVRRKAWASVDGRSSDEMQALMPLAKGKARALEIIDRYAAGGVTQAELAAEYGMSSQNIARIIRRSLATTADAVPHR